MRLYMFALKVLTCIFVSFTAPLWGASVIMRTDDIHVFQEMTQNAGPHSLVIFDINDTLLLAKEPIFQSSHKYQRLALQYELEELYSKARLHQFWAYLRLKIPRDLIDPRAVDLIQDLQAKNVKVIALTTAGMGPLTQDLSLEDWKLDLLKGFRIDFSKAFPELPCLHFKYLPTKHPGRYPGFKEGVLFTCGLSKGLLLNLLLKTLNYKPETIFFIDDKLKNLLAVEEVCKEMGISFGGCHYTAFSQKNLKPLDKKKIYQELEAFLQQVDSAQ